MTRTVDKIVYMLIFHLSHGPLYMVHINLKYDKGQAEIYIHCL